MNKMTEKFQRFGLLFLGLYLAACTFSVNAQSASVDFPTAVSTNELSGKISARDIGDARLTTYYYMFEGTQGDMFINVSAANFNGDIDIFIAETLRPLSKISFYGDTEANETGRVIYLRKPERLILRVQGRTPDDNPATFKIKFAGSFVAVQDSGENQQPKLPEIDTENTTGIRVNSVGTIIETKPGQTTRTGNTVAEETGEKAASIETDDKVIAPDNADAGESKKDNEETAVKEKTETTPPPARRTRPATRTGSATNRGRNNTRRTGTGSVGTTASTKTVKPPVNKPDAANAEANPLENVQMIVLMKTGERLEFTMTEVFRFSMTGGVLTITMKDGKIHRRSLLDIQKMTIE